MPESEKLFIRHPEGHETTIPCAHLIQQHPNGDTLTIPCTHGFRQAHPAGDIVFGARVPCIHLVPIHPNGDNKTIPCAHIVQQHSDGHPGPVVPCIHPMEVVRSEFGGRLLFYAGNSVIQETVMDAVDRLNTLGVSLLSVRPLHIFHRGPLASGDGNDPFWSHYNPLFHSIQVIDNGQSDQRIVETLRHELGHALVGNQITNHYAGGSHTLTNEANSYALAMSEGWAHFVALVLTYDASQGRDVKYKGENWETLSITPNGKIEYCVGSCLWDLFDSVRIRLMRTRFGGRMIVERDELATIAFSEFFRVYSPTLETIFNGPWISSIWDFVDRIKKNNADNPTLVGLIDEVTLLNVGARPADA